MALDLDFDFDLSDILGWATGPGGQFLASLFASDEQAKAEEEAATRTDQQIADALALAEERVGEGQDIYGEGMQPALDELQELHDRTQYDLRALSRQTLGFGNAFLTGFEERGDETISDYRGDQASFLEDLSGREQSILGGYGGRYSYAQDQLSQLGGQGRADINRLFDEEQARVTLDLQQRGLLSSSEAARGGYDVAEQRSAELRRFEESLTRERIDVLSALSGEGLSAEERLGAQHAGYQYGGQQTAFGAQTGLDAAQAAYERAVRGDVLGAEQNIINYDMQTSGALANLQAGMGANQANLYMQGSGDWLNTMMGINYQPPPQSNLPFTFGQNAVQPVQGPSSWEMMMPGLINAGGDIAGAAMMAAALSGGSDRNMKDHIRSLDVEQVLDSLVQLPVHKWRYKGDATEHVGPMAQDFNAAFAVGTDTAIHLVDVAGVLIASVQALYAELRELRQEIKQGAVAA